MHSSGPRRQIYTVILVHLEDAGGRGCDAVFIRTVDTDVTDFAVILAHCLSNIYLYSNNMNTRKKGTNFGPYRGFNLLDLM